MIIKTKKKLGFDIAYPCKKRVVAQKKHGTSM